MNKLYWVQFDDLCFPFALPFGAAREMGHG